MLTALLAFLGSSGFGSLLGGLMGWLNRRVDVDVKRLEMDHEKARWDHERAMRAADLEQVKAEAAGRREVAVVEGEASVESARMAALAAAYASDKLDAEEVKAAGWWSWTLVLSDAFRRVIRPAVTVALLTVTLYLDVLLVDRWQRTDWASLTPQQRYDLMATVFAWIGAQTSAAVSYWFVARGSSK